MQINLILIYDNLAYFLFTTTTYGFEIFILNGSSRKANLANYSQTFGVQSCTKVHVDKM